MKANVSKNYDYVQLKKNACQKIDEAAERERLKFSTAGSTMASIYQYKLEEAKSFMALSQNDKDNATQVEYPFLFADMASAGGSPQASAEAVIAANQVWKTHMARIEHVRRHTKTSIMLSPNDKAVIDALVTNVNFNLEITYT